MANNVATYIGNIGKSVTYAAVDKFKSMAPATADFVENNGELYKTIYDSVRNYRNTYVRAHDVIKGSKVYEAADVGMQNIIESIKTGTFYSKEREDKINSRIMGFDDDSGTAIDESSWGDLSLDQFESDMNNDFGEFSDGDVAIVESIQASSRANADAVSMAIAKTGEYTANVSRAGTDLLYTQNEKFYNRFSNELESINTNIINLLDFNSKVVQVHADNSQKYYETTTNIMQEQLKLLKKIADNVAPDENNKKKKEKITYDSIVTSNGVPNLKTYFDNVKKNFGNTMRQYIPSMDMGMEGNELLTLVTNPLAFIPKFFVNSLVPKTMEKAMAELDKSITGFFGSLMTKANKMKNSDSPLLSAIGNILGISGGLKSSLNTNTYEKGKVPWDGKSKKALEEVIPTYLAKIESLLSGQNAKIFDYEKGAFVNAIDINKQFDSMKESFVKSFSSEMNGLIDELKKNLTFDSLRDKESLDKDIKKIFTEMFNSGEYFDVNNKNLDSLAMKYGVSSRNMKLFRTMFKNTPLSAQQQINAKLMEERENQTKRFNKMEEENSIYKMLFNNSNLSEYVKTDKTTGITTPKGVYGNLLSVEDKKGHNIFYYLENINKELTWIRLRGTNGSASSNTNYYNNDYVDVSTGYDSYSVDLINSFEDLKTPKRPGYKSQRELYNERRRKDEERFIKNEDRRRSKNKNLVNASTYDESEEDIASRLQLTIERNKIKDKMKEAREEAKNKSLIDQLLESDSISKKFQTLRDRLNNIAQKPITFLTDSIRKADQHLYQVIYGSEDGKGFMDLLMDKTKETFNRLNTWLDEKILEPFKNKMGIEDIRDLGSSLMKRMGIDPEEFKEKISTFLFGEKNGDKREGGLFGSTIQATKDVFSNSWKYIKDSVKGTWSDVKNSSFVQSIKEKTKNPFESLTNKGHELQLSHDESNNYADYDETDDTNVDGTPKRKKSRYIDFIEADTGGVHDKRYWEWKLKMLQENKSKFKSMAAYIRQVDNAREHLEAFEGEGGGDRRSSMIRHTSKMYNKLYSQLGLDSLMTPNELMQISRDVNKDRRLSNFNDSATIDDIMNSVKNLYKNKSGKQENYKNIIEILDGKKSEYGSNVFLLDLLNGTINPRTTSRQFAEQFPNLVSDPRFNPQGNNNQGTGGVPDVLVGYVKDIRDFMMDLKDRLKPQVRNTRRPSIPQFNIPGPYNIDSSEDEAMKNMSSGLADVIYQFFVKNFHHFDQGSNVLDRPVLASLKEGELVLQPKTVNALTNLLNTIAEGIGQNDFDLGKHANGLYQKIQGKAKKQGITNLDFLDNILDRVDTSKMDKYQIEALQSVVSGVKEEYRANNEVDEKGIPIDPVKRAAYMEMRPFIQQMGVEFVSGLSSVKKSLFGNSEEENSEKFGEAIDDITSQISTYAPKAIGTGLLGAGVSLVTGAVGGPLLGAAIGAGTSLALQSEKVQTWLLGEKMGDERTGGFIPKKGIDFFKKYIPDMGKYGVTGAVAGLLPILPFGPVGGLLLGSSLAFAKNNEDVRGLIFGDQGLFSEKSGQKLKKMLPRMGLGALLTTGLGIGPFGLLGTALLGAGAGMLTTMDGFRDFVLGKYNEYTGEYEDGIVPALRHNIVDPLKNFGKDIKDKFFEELRTTFFDPLKRFAKPLGKSIKNVINGMYNMTEKAIDKAFGTGIGVPIRKWFSEKLIPKTVGFAKGVGKVASFAGKYTLGLPFQLLGGIGDIWTGRQIKHGDADYLTAAERLKYSKDHKLTSLGGITGGESYKTYGYDKFLANAQKEDIDNVKTTLEGLQDLQLSDKQKMDKLNKETGDKISQLYKYDDSKAIMKAINDGDIESARLMMKASDAQKIKSLKDIQTNGIDLYNKKAEKIERKAAKKGWDEKTIEYKKRQAALGLRKTVLKDLSAKDQKDILDLIQSGNSSGLNKFINGRIDQVDNDGNDVIKFIENQKHKYKNFQNQKANSDEFRAKYEKELSKLGIKMDLNNPKMIDKYLNYANAELGRFKDEKSDELISDTPEDPVVQLDANEQKRHETIVELFTSAVNALNTMAYGRSEDDKNVQNFIDSKVADEKDNVRDAGYYEGFSWENKNEISKTNQLNLKNKKIKGVRKVTGSMNTGIDIKVHDDHADEKTEDDKIKDKINNKEKYNFKYTPQMEEEKNQVKEERIKRNSFYDRMMQLVGTGTTDENRNANSEKRKKGTLFDKIGNAVTGAKDKVKGAGKGINSIISGLLALIPGVGPIASMAINAVPSLLPILVGGGILLYAFRNQIWSFITEKLPALITEWTPKIISGIIEAVPGLMDFSANLVDAITKGISDVGLDLGAKILNAIGLEKAANSLENLKYSNSENKPADAPKTTGEKIRDGLLTGIKYTIAPIPTTISYAKKTYNNIKNWWKGRGGPDDNYIDDLYSGKAKPKYTGMGGPYNNAQEYIQALVPGAQKAYEKYGVFPSVTLGQALGEAGWQMSQPAAYKDNNLFGIKFAGNHSPDLQISEGTAPSDGTGGVYAHYNSISDSVEDHGFFLRNNKRYAEAGAFEAKNGIDQIKAIANAGYATDPNYFSFISGLIKSNNLQQYDTGTYVGTGATSSGSSSSSENSSSDSTSSGLMGMISDFGKAISNAFNKTFGWNTANDNNGGTQNGSGVMITGSGIAAKAAQAALSCLGTPYKWGGTDPKNGGVDCSGLMQWAYKQAGVELSRTTTTQIKEGKGISINNGDYSNLKVGDLVFPHTGHVGMYIGNGQYVHSPQTGDVVKISEMSGRSKWLTARRIVEEGETATSTAENANVFTENAAKNEDKSSSSSSSSGNAGIEFAKKLNNSSTVPNLRIDTLKYAGSGGPRILKKAIGGAAAKYFEKALGGNQTSGFGLRDGLGKVSNTHTGIDIGAKQGKKIPSPIGGRVISKQTPDKSNGYGNLVVVKDEQGSEHYFGHMENQSNLKPGDIVKPGDTLGRVGNTGNSTGSHLHYEVRKNGIPVEPNNALNQYYTQQTSRSSKKNTGIGGSNEFEGSNNILQSLLKAVLQIANNTQTLNNILELVSKIVGGGTSNNSEGKQAIEQFRKKTATSANSTLLTAFSKMNTSNISLDNLDTEQLLELVNKITSE